MAVGKREETEMLTIERLTGAVREDSAIRRIRRLQPAGGAGDKIFPPTYPGDGRGAAPRHVFEFRRIEGRDVLCVLIDSVQSQANRLEEALKNLRASTGAFFPVIAVDFKGTPVADLGQITSLDAPHRVFDAIIRDSQKGKLRFRDTDEGKRLVEAKAQNAVTVFELSPTALVFGAWNSTGQGGGLGAKFPRCLVSEIVGIGVATDSPGKPSGQRTGSRIDPLGIRSGVKVYREASGDWTLDPVKKGEAMKPSEINHSNIAPTVQPLGVSVEYGLHTFVLSCAALRRLRFADPNKTTDADTAAQTALAALGLAGLVAQDRDGYALRSRCDLVPEEGQSAGLEIIKADGLRERVELSVDGAVALLKSAAGRAAEMGIRWNSQDLVLEPQPKLVELVRQSRELALKGEPETEQAES
jgi:CRISPR-associated protein Csb1